MSRLREAVLPAMSDTCTVLFSRIKARPARPPTWTDGHCKLWHGKRCCWWYAIRGVVVREPE